MNRKKAWIIFFLLHVVLMGPGYLSLFVKKDYVNSEVLGWLSAPFLPTFIVAVVLCPYLLKLDKIVGRINVYALISVIGSCFMNLG